MPDRVADIPLRPGDGVLVPPWVLHRHHRLWETPGAFDPRRFLSSATPPDRLAYLPFGAGTRACIRAHFALIEATLVLTAILRRFGLELVRQRPVLPIAVLTTVLDRRALFRLRPR
jgi:cytochrome P450